jgi:uncharacterized surface protein with fasciclin (FAS1) repeats
MKRNYFKTTGLIMLVVAALLAYSCKKELFKISTTNDVNITGYLEQNPDTYSMLLQILEKSKTQGYLGAYGTYTLFAPTNSAIQNWLKEQGKSSINDFSDEDLLNFVKYHVVKDTVSTVRFSDGKIKTPTLFGEFLYTDVANGTYRVNKEAFISKMNILCGNGIIQSIDKVLVPPAKNLAELIESNGRYTIFTAALKATGFYDTLKYQRGEDIATEKRFQTVIAQSDSLYNTLEIYDLDDLIDKYSNTNSPKNHNDSLWLYMAYHIMNDGKFLEDIAGSSSLYTLAPKEIISTSLDVTRILLNETVFNGIKEPGAEINRDKSDNLAVNGVMHEAKDNFYIKVRQQVPVYFDVTSSPELIAALGSAYGNATRPLVVNGKSITSSIIFEDPAKTQSNNYDFWSALEAKRPRANGDYLNLSTCNANAARQKFVDIKTPYLVKGRYKVWVCYVQNNNGSHFQTTYDPGTPQQQILPNIVYCSSTLTAGSGLDNTTIGGPNADNLMLVQGYKRYMATTAETNANGVRGLKPVSGGDAGLNVGRLAGIINVETTDRHIIRLTAVGDGGNRCSSNTTWIDMIHFIPADDNEQIYPRFHVTPGELFYRP